MAVLNDARNGNLKRDYPTCSYPYNLKVESLNKDGTGHRDWPPIDENDNRQVEQQESEDLDTDDPWRSKMVLSLDGGGVRVYSSLLILNRLMHLIEDEERHTEPCADSSTSSPMIEADRPKAEAAKSPATTESRSAYFPCHYFDYIAGTSTGGLIAILLGRLRMSVDDCLKEYEKLYSTVFIQGSISRLSRIMKYKSWNTPTQSELDRWAKTLRPAQSSPDERSDRLSSDPERCKTIICSIHNDSRSGFAEPHLCRSYPHDDKPISSTQQKQGSRDSNDNLWEVARATTAAPMFFKHARINSTLNNPSYEVLKEFDAINKNNNSSIGLFLSIGCSRSTETRATGQGTVRLLLDRHTYQVSEAVHKLMTLETSGFDYYRLDAKNELLSVCKEERKRKGGTRSELEDMEHSSQATKRYLESTSTQERLRTIAHNLVLSRRRRSKTMRWERFALGTRYKCNYPLQTAECVEKVFETRNEYMDHLRQCHEAESPGANNYEIIKSVLDRGRINSDSSGTSSTQSQPSPDLKPSRVSSPNMMIFK